MHSFTDSMVTEMMNLVMKIMLPKDFKHYTYNDYIQNDMYLEQFGVKEGNI